MTQHRDFKKLVRARMSKTGEAYTAARSILVAKRARTEVPAVAPAAAPPKAPADFAALAGMSDEAVAAKTGHGWAKWVKSLDHHGMADKPHQAIARFVHETYGVSGWWAQTVTIGYERIKGLRDIGQRRSGAYEANKSKTVAVPVATLYRAWRDKAQRDQWLGPVALTVRKATPEKSLRITWDDGTSVELWLTSKGDSKSSVQVQHTRLTSKADAEVRKVFWGEKLEALAAFLTAGPVTAAARRARRR